MNKFYSIFDRMDDDSSGQIEMAEMLKYFHLSNEKLNRRLFDYFDQDNRFLSSLPPPFSRQFLII